MAETDFDAIVVGSGCAGAVAAYELAKAGKSTLVVERGNFAGAKNMTGRRIYSHSLKKVFPELSPVPLDARSPTSASALAGPASQTAVNHELSSPRKQGLLLGHHRALRPMAGLRPRNKAEYICGIAVEELLKDRSGRVVGVRRPRTDHRRAIVAKA